MGAASAVKSDSSRKEGAARRGQGSLRWVVVVGPLGQGGRPRTEPALLTRLPSVFLYLLMSDRRYQPVQLIPESEASTVCIPCHMTGWQHTWDSLSLSHSHTHTRLHKLCSSSQMPLTATESQTGATTVSTVSTVSTDNSTETYRSEMSNGRHTCEMKGHGAQ